ncbi:unnamed protein product [Effrenium voratum]|nr:unnamed protein product [Effrenium voratum]
MGGENLCVTRGVVSRIDLMDYTFSPVGGERQLVIQVDAAINPGNSGGPVLDAFGRVLGVAFAAMRQGASIGYVIPGSVVRFFLKAAAASAGGAMDSSLCALGVRLQPARAPALRAVRGLDQGSGALIAEVAPLSAAAAAGVEAGDVLLAVDGVPVAEDCTVPFRDAERIGFDFLISRRVAGDAMRLQIWRGAEKELQLQAAPLPQLVPRTPGVDARPSYLVVGGLVFTRLTLPWLLARFSEEVRKAPAELQAKLWEHKEHADQEVVVLAKVLSADLNYGYEEFQCCELLRFGAGGAPVRSLKQLRAEVLAALRGEGEGGPAAYLRFCFSFNLEIVLDAEQCRTSHNEILRQYGIHQDCSSDLMDNSEIRSKL